MDQFSRYRARGLLDAVIVILPILTFIGVILWFSGNPISANASVEASATNLAGFVTSNFVYDGVINIENILSSAVFLLVICFYYPRGLRVLVAYLLPLIALTSGGLAELTAISTPYISLRVCVSSCSFYGMSGIASATVGFTAACFLISFAMFGLQRRARRKLKLTNSPSQLGRPRTQAILAVAFVAYVVLLLFFSGLIPLPVQSSAHQGQAGSLSSSSPSSSPSPPAILTQTPPVALVHAASLVYGSLFCLSIFFRANRWYHFFGPG